jgi:hypothetical protein
VSEEKILNLPPLSQEDQSLIDAYVNIGRPVDQLPYTKEFDRLVKALGKPETAEEKYRVYQRLLNLRKRARLPRIYPTFA